VNSGHFVFPSFVEVDERGMRSLCVDAQNIKTGKYVNGFLISIIPSLMPLPKGGEKAFRIVAEMDQYALKIRSALNDPLYLG
jgi:hypothetical protein